MKTVIQNILLVYLFLSSPVFLPALAAADDSGDIVVLFDSSISLRQNRPDIVPELWLQTFIGKIPETTELVIVNFDDAVQAVSTITSDELNSGKARIPDIPINGLITDFATPLHYLAEYKGHIILAAIISDGKPEIWDKRSGYLSGTVLENEEYGLLNRQYRQESAKGLSQKELYTMFNSQYAEKNYEIIQKHLATLAGNLKERLMFVDVSGKFPFLEQWAVVANGRYIDATNRLQPVHLQADLQFAKNTSKSNSMEGPIPLDLAPLQEVETVLQAPLAAPQLPLSSQPENIPPLPSPAQPENLTPVAANSQASKPTEVEIYKANPMNIAIAVLITAGIFLMLFYIREKRRSKKSAALESELLKKQQEIITHIDRKKTLEKEQQELSKSLKSLQEGLAAAADKKMRIAEEIDLVHQQLEADQNAVRDKLHLFEKEHKTQIDADIKRYSDEKHIALHEQLDQLKEERLVALDQEMTAARQNRLNAIEQEANSATLKSTEEWQQLEKRYENRSAEMEAELLESQEALRSLGNNKNALQEEYEALFGNLQATQKSLAATGHEKERIKEELSHVEQQHQATMQRWEGEAEQRIIGLLNSRYREKIADYQNNIKQLHGTYTLLRERLDPMQAKSDELQSKIDGQRQLFDKLTATKVETLIEERRQKEELLWEQTSLEIQQAKEEALMRIHKREGEARQL